jgi:hypothetical protein
VEGWHSSLKCRASVTKKRVIARRPIWLLNLLVGEVDEHYTYMAHIKEAGAVRHAAAAAIEP